MQRWRNDERGATLVEYALMVALVALVSLAAIDLLEGAARQSYDRAEFSVGRGTSVTTTTKPKPPPTTTKPVTTTTTRPAATTTTRPAATTTTTAPRRSSAALVDVTTATSGWTRWTGSAVVRLTDTTGAAVAGARVQVRVTAGGSTQTVTVTTDASGRATVDVGPYDWLFGGITSAELTVVGVDGGNVPWDGVGPSTTISIR
jgi:Flp pilus assembly pilin Flp